ncbi:ubiquitin elongating factor core-domain-containing protein, partial [Amanita rubescens]
WEHETIEQILKVTLDKAVSERSGYDIVWLKYAAQDMVDEGISIEHLNADMIDRLLRYRLSIDPKITDDLYCLSTLASLPAQQTAFEYLVGSWKRFNSARTAFKKKGYPPLDTQKGLELLEKIRHLVLTYVGLNLQNPEMFSQPEGRPVGAPELIAPLLSLSALSGPFVSGPPSSPNVLTPSDIGQFIQDLACRFEPDSEIDNVLGPVVNGLLFHESLFRPEGLGGDASWRGVIRGLEALVSTKSVATMITRMEAWNPPNATALNFERTSLLGPLCRLGVFYQEWASFHPRIEQMYFSEPEKRSRSDIEFSFASLREALKNFQNSLFQIFNTLVRASPEAQDAVLQYFARIISLNVKRAGMQVDPNTVSSDSFMLNILSVLLRFAEPFMDANYTKMDRIDPLYFVNCSLISIKDETRIKVSSEEATTWEDEHRDPTGSVSSPNFISNIFFLTVAMSHFGYIKTISTYKDLDKVREVIQRHLDWLQGVSESWMGGPFQAQIEAAIKQAKLEQDEIRSQKLTFEAGIVEPELVYRSIGFISFLSTWLIRQVDPTKKHPNPLVILPLPKEVPMAFRVLPEYIVEDIVDSLHFFVKISPENFELPGLKVDMLVFALTFLTSTWYIKNPFLKAKINEILFMGTWRNHREWNGVLGNLLNTHPLALKHLMAALMNFYIEVEHDGEGSRFYDRFSIQCIFYILLFVWNNPAHREALDLEAKKVDRFVRFINIMINDVTYLMDSSFSGLTSIHNIQVEMDDKKAWNARPQEYRRERESTLRNMEQHATSYITLGRSTVELLKMFTAETKAPFMVPEIVCRLAAMLDYNLVALAGPKYQELKVREPEKLNFDPKALLSDILQVYMNLDDQPEFVMAMARDDRSYSKGLFERASSIASRANIKSEKELGQLRVLIEKVEKAKVMLDAEDDLGKVPDEFLDPLTSTIMRDPVLLPSSRAIVDRTTIKSHLLSDTKDPFNRAPLTLEDVQPCLDLKYRIDKFIIHRRSEMRAPPLWTPRLIVSEFLYESITDDYLAQQGHTER